MHSVPPCMHSEPTCKHVTHLLSGPYRLLARPPPPSCPYSSSPAPPPSPSGLRNQRGQCTARLLRPECVGCSAGIRGGLNLVSRWHQSGVGAWASAGLAASEMLGRDQGWAEPNQWHLLVRGSCWVLRRADAGLMSGSQHSAAGHVRDHGPGIFLKLLSAKGDRPRHQSMRCAVSTPGPCCAVPGGI